jgi:hypothetical protein
MASASNEIAELHQQMDRVRKSASVDVHDLVENTRALTDWRRYWRHHPWAWCGAATVLGYYLVPARRFGNSDSQGLAELRLAELSQASQAKASAPRKNPILSELAGIALGILIQQGKQLVAQRVARVIDSYKANQVHTHDTGKNGNGGSDQDHT